MNKPNFFKKNLWLVTTIIIILATPVIFVTANSPRVVSFIDSGSIAFGNTISSIAALYINLLPKNIYVDLSNFLVLVSSSISKQVFRSIILTNLIAATIITVKSISGTFLALLNLLSNKSSTRRIFLPLLVFFINKTKEKPWGIVYDSVNKKPIDPAVVTIATHENGVGEFKQIKTTDMGGRFSFLVTPGHYVITAEKTNYIFPSQRVKGSTDGKFKNIYHGEIIQVKDASIINLNIPMDPLGFDWNQANKPNTYNSVVGFINEKGRLFTIVMGITTAITTYIFLPSAINIYLLFIYSFNLLFVKTQIRKKLWGVVYNKSTKEVIPRVSVKAIDQKLNITFGHTTTDHLGRYYLLVSKGIYTLVVEKEEKDMEPQVLSRIENVVVSKKNEIINFDIGI